MSFIAFKEVALNSTKSIAEKIPDFSREVERGGELKNSRINVGKDLSRLNDNDSESEQEETSSKEIVDSNIDVKDDAPNAADPEARENEQLSDEQKETIKKETGWSDEVVDNIKNMDQYDALRNANLTEVEINGRKCLIKSDIDLDYVDADGISNRERMQLGLAPLDSKTGKPIELHHLGQKPDSPLVELTEEEHRTGDYKDGKKNQSLWHERGNDSEVHGEGNTWSQERKEHWQTRSQEN